MEDRRIRDPVHGLIVVSRNNAFDDLIWKLLDAPEFQRLRRIKQLGLSELVYPGATHTRFSHCVGVFHTARELVDVLRDKLGESFDQDEANVAICAALLHDLGHGPFSHAFESVESDRGQARRHEKWTTEIVQQGPRIPELLHEYDEAFAGKVVALLSEETPSSVYSTVVASQFDADRVDYLRRDKLMTGTEHGGFDWEWLLNNLEVGDVTIGGEQEEDTIQVDALVLGSKGLSAAEAYLLGRFHLYTQVYMHKTTRGAEKLLAVLLTRVAELVSKDEGERSGLPELHPLRSYFAEGGNTLENYLNLDDTTVWGSLALLQRSRDPVVSETASRLATRNLYKCFDVQAKAKQFGGDLIPKFKRRLDEDESLQVPSLLRDRTTVSAYKYRDFESADALSKVLIRRSDGSGRQDDVANLSAVVGAMEPQPIFRIYMKDENVRARVEAHWGEAT